MPVTLKKGHIFYKNNSGTYTGLDVITDKATQQQIDLIQNAKGYIFTQADQFVENLKSSLPENFQTILENFSSTYIPENHQYTVGDYCIYEGTLYRCIADTNGTFDSTDWEAVKIGTEFQNVDAEIDDLKSATTIVNNAVFGDVDSTFPLEFENGTYYYVTVGETLQKYYGGGYDLTRKVIKSTVFNAPCKVELEAKSGYAFTVFNALNSVIQSTSGLVTKYVLNPGQQYGMMLRTTGGTDDISNVPVKSIIDIEYNVVDDLKSIVDDIKSALETKAEIDGSYEQMTVGNAEQLVSAVGIEDKVPYNFRIAGGGSDIGDREVSTVVGGTVVWNQLKKYNSTPETRTLNNVTVVDNQNGSYTVSTTEEGATENTLIGVNGQSTNYTVYANHKYFKSGAKISEGIKIRDSYKGLSLGTTDEGIFTFNNVVESKTNYNVSIEQGTIITNPVTIWPMLIDLTQTFGSNIADYIYSLETANRGAGVAWFRKLFPKTYYAYNAGELMNVKTNVHKMTGFNAWDEKWINAQVDISTTTGEPVGTSLWYFRSSNYIPIIPRAVYYDNNNMIGNTDNYRIFYYDKNKQYIGYISHRNKTEFTVPNNAYYMKFRFTSTSTTAYRNNICINLSWDGERNGEYEPYTSNTYPLDDVELRGIPKLDGNNKLYYDGDIYESDGFVTRRFGAVDMGTVTWRTATSAAGTPVFISNAISDLKKPTNSIIPNMRLYNAYPVKSWDNLNLGPNSPAGIAAFGDKSIRVVDSAYTDADTFKAAMSGVYLIYELDSPIIEEAVPFQRIQIVDNFGTEEYVDAEESAETPTRDVAIPVGHVTTYLPNLRAKLEMAPNSPSDGDGDYVVRQTSGINSYVKLNTLNVLPSVPTTNGSYHLKCTVANGTAIYTWEVDT